ncbi:MAG: cysteine--1-D-myo-inosityl 2-amino-2-deoxy-alpha-D-glucopyranoside ligase [Nocardioidaceae bacterium]
MRSWTSPAVPSLAEAGFGSGPVLRLHDTASGAFAESPAAGSARLYVCGITPYDATHLGHAATFIAFDGIVRMWRDAGLDVTYVQNVTDVDEPLLARAAATGDDWQALAERETQLFRADMESLRVLAPDHYVGAVESIPPIIVMVAALLDSGAAYRLGADVYFDVSADDTFGSVSGYDAARMRALAAERGGDPDRPGKRSPLDCLLWSAARPGEPAWDAPFGSGRPGWHVECSAIAVQRLGIGFDVQGGGNDLIYPHHEMSAAHAQVACGKRPFAQAYVHAGMIGLDGEKMSKSRGNLVLVSRLREAGVDPAALRLAVLAHHYRSNWEWTDLDLQAARDRLLRWRDAAGHSAGPPAAGVADAVRTALADDLDTPRALAAVDVWAAEVIAGASGGHMDTDAPGSVGTLTDALLGVPLADP